MASWPTASTGAISGESKCGPPGTTASRGRRFGTSCTTATGRSRRPFGFRCTARVAAPITFARRPRSTTPMAASRPGASRDPKACTTSSKPSRATSRCNTFGDRWPEFNRRPGSSTRRLSRPKNIGPTSSTSTAAPGLRRAEERPRQQGRASGRGGPRRRARQAHRRFREGIHRSRRSGSPPANT